MMPPGHRPILAALRAVLLGAVAGLVVPAGAQQVASAGSGSLVLTSPDGELRAEVSVTAASELVFSLHHGPDVLLGESPLGITVDGVDLGTGAAVASVPPPKEATATYERPGVSTPLIDHHLSYRITVFRSGPGDSEFSLEARLADDGLAIRYFIPGSAVRTISGERTGWAVPPGSRLWYQPDTADYAGIYRDALAGTVDSEAGGPLTVELPSGGYLVLSEAALFEYSGLSFDLDAGGSTLIRSAFLDNAQWPKQGGFASPWRVTLHAPTLDQLVNSSLFTDLCPRPKHLSLPGGARSPWIRPGRILGPTPGPGDPPPTFESILGLIDQAHALGFDYVLIPDGWEDSLPTETEDKWARLEIGRAHV